MTDWDVVIVGAGPVGGYAAYKLAEMGHRILILEEYTWPTTAKDCCRDAVVWSNQN